MSKFSKYIIHPSFILLKFDEMGLIKLDDEYFLKLKYKKIFNKDLDLKNPQTFNEKLQWLKLHDRKDVYTTMVDKYEAKKYVADIIGEEYIIPTLGIYDKFDDIDFDKLPNQFVMKCTHDSGGIVICKDKTKLDMQEAEKKIEKSLKRNYFYNGREWPYKNVKPRIIVEKYMVDESNKELKDYKVFNFNGEPKIIEVDYNRFIEHKRNLYDKDWNYIEAAIQYPTDSDKKIKKPENLYKMLELAKILSKDIPFVRTDFYSIEDKIYFGELTFYHGSGLEKFNPDSFDKELGKWLKLPGGGYLLKNDNIVFLIKGINNELKDYKFFCFNGEPKFLYVSEGLENHKTAKISFFDMNFNREKFKRSDYREFDQNPKKPVNFEKMKELAKALSSGHTFLRVDLYEINNQIYFSELTFSPCAGYLPFEPEEWDYKLGSLIKLPKVE